MKRTEIVIDYPAKEDDNLRYIKRTVSTPENATGKQNLETKAITDAQPIQKAPIDPERDEKYLNHVKTSPTTAENHSPTTNTQVV